MKDTFSIVPMSLVAVVLTVLTVVSMILIPPTSVGQATPQATPQVTPQVSVVVVVLTDTNQLPIVLRAITNAVPSAVIHKSNPKVAILETEIKLMERRFKENYEGLPTTFNAVSSPESGIVLDQLIAASAQRDKDAAVIEAKKAELRKMQ